MQQTHIPGQAKYSSVDAICYLECPNFGSEAIVNELLNYRVSMAGLTETRLKDNGVQ